MHCRAKAAHNAGVGKFGVLQKPGLLQFFRRHDVGSASFFLTGKSLVIPLRADFTTRLSGIILISEAMFGAGFDLERIGLRAVSGRF